MKKLLIAALLVSSFAHAATAPTEMVFHKFLVYGTLSEGNRTMVITRNPAMALIVVGVDSRTMDRISTGRLLCTVVEGDRKKRIQERALSQSALASQLDQAIAMGFPMDDAKTKTYNEGKGFIKFVNDAADDPYYDCQ